MPILSQKNLAENWRKIGNFGQIILAQNWLKRRFHYGNGDKNLLYTSFYLLLKNLTFQSKYLQKRRFWEFIPLDRN